MALTVSPPWTRTTLTLFFIVLVLQFAAVIGHISFLTFWIGFLGEKSKVEVLKYVYTTLLLSTAFLLSLLATESLYCISANPDTWLQPYLELQRIKMRLLGIEFLALALLFRGVEDWDTVAKVLLLTGCSRIPFKLGFALALLVRRRDKKRLERVAKEIDEESPLLA